MPEVLKREEPFYFYKLLGISTKASQQEIRTAYRSKALSVHPDKNDGHEDMFLVVKEAYDTLSNIPKRCAYDREQSGLPKLPRVVGFKRPPPLPSVVAGISYVLPDGMPYVFETAPSVLRCGLTHGDMLGWDDETGYFVGMAGDNCWWWCKGNSDVAIKLCDPSSSMMRSRITVLSHTKRMARYTGSKPFVRLSSTMGPRSSTGKGSCDSLSDRQKGMNGLERMRQEIIREGQMKARLRAKESLLRDEMSLRKMRTESWIEALQELHQRFQSIKLRLKLFLAPTEGEWDALFAEARAPSTPLYAKPASVVPKTSASHVDPTGRQRSCSTSSSSSSCSPHAKSDSSTECKGASIEIAMKAVKPTSSSKEAAMLSQRSKTESEKATRKSTVKMKKTGSISTQEEPKKMSSGH